MDSHQVFYETRRLIGPSTSLLIATNVTHTLWHCESPFRKYIKQKIVTSAGPVSFLGPWVEWKGPNLKLFRNVVPGPAIKVLL